MLTGFDFACNYRLAGKELHIREFFRKSGYFVRIGKQDAASMPGAVEELPARTVGKFKCHDFVSHFKGSVLRARFYFFGRMRFNPVKNLVGDFVRNLVARNADGDAVSKENFGIAFGDDGADAPTLESLRRVFTAGAATKIPVGNQNGAVFVSGIAERVRFPLFGKAGYIVGKGVVAQTIKGDALEEARRNDAVSVDVVSTQRDAGTFYRINHSQHNRFAPYLMYLRTSVTLPSIAAAATIIGLIRMVRPVGLP